MFSKYLLVILTFILYYFYNIILFFNITLLFYMILNKVWCIAYYKLLLLFVYLRLVLCYNTVKCVISTPKYHLSAFTFAYTVKSIILKIAEISILMIFLTFMHSITKTTHLMSSFLKYLLLFHIYKKKDVCKHFLCYGFLWISLSKNNMNKLTNIITKLTYLFFVSKTKRIIAQDLNRWLIKVSLDFSLVSLNYCSYILGFSIFIACFSLLNKVLFYTTSNLFNFFIL